LISPKYEPTKGQKALWFAQEANPFSTHYNVTSAVTWSGDVTVEALEYALCVVVQRHAPLRTVYRERHGRLWAYETDDDPQIRNVGLDSHDATVTLDALMDLVMRSSHEPFQLASKPPFRALIARVSPTEIVVATVVHHIACDGWSVKVLWDEIATIVDDFRKGAESSLAPLPATFADFVQSESSEKSRTRRARDVKWALGRLQGDLENLVFPFHGLEQPSTRITLQATLSARDRLRLADLAADNSSPAGSPYLAALLGALRVQLGRDDFPIVIPASGRLDPTLSDLVGYFVRPVVVAQDRREQLPLPEDALQVAADLIFDAEEHQGATIEDILAQDQYAGARRPSGVMAQIAFQYMGPAFHTIRTAAGIDARPLEVLSGNDPLALELCVHDDGERAVVLLLVDTAFVDEATARSILDDLLANLDAGGPANARLDVTASRHHILAQGADLTAAGDADITPDSDRRLTLVLSAFSSALQITDPDPDTDFFTAGGHSLALMDLIAALSEATGVTLDLRAVLQNSTPRGLSALIAPRDDHPLTIVTRGGRGDAPLVAPNQRRLWALQMLHPMSTEYNSTQAFTLTGQLDVDALTKAISLVVRKYDVLRTVIPADVNGLPAPEETADEPGLVVLDGEPASAPAESVAVREASRPFSVDEQAPVRFVLARRSELSWSLVITLHHLASDAVSNRIIAREVGDIYTALIAGRVLTSEAPLQFSDFAHWKLSDTEKNYDRKSLEFWDDALDDFRDVSSLATQAGRGAGPSLSSAIQFDIDAQTSRRVDELARELGITRFAVLFCAHQISVAGLLGRERVVTGVVTSGRYLPELSDVVGFFANLLPVPTRLLGRRHLTDTLHDVHATLVSCYQHETVNYESIVERARPERHPGSDPLVRNTFQLIDVPAEPPLKMPGVTIDELFVPSAQTPFELAMDLFASEGGLRGVLEYDRAAFEHDDAEAVVSAFLAALACVTSINGPDTVDDVWMALGTPLDRAPDFTEEAPGEAPARDIVEVFVAVAAERPDDIALVDEQSRWTFAETLSAVDAVAASLDSFGLQPGSRVGLLTSRSRWFVAAAFGAMKAGMTVVPLDDADPLARKTEVMKAAEVRLVLSDVRTQSEAQFLGPTLLVGEHLLSSPNTPLSSSRVHLDEAAYIIFTSGTTGRPKGVAVGHAALANLLESHSQSHHARAMARAGRRMRVAHMVSMAFDLSWDAFAWMLGGNSVFIVADEVRRDTARLVGYLHDSQIDVVECTPSQLEQMIAAGYLSDSAWAPTFVAIGGEPVSPALWNRLAGLALLAYNFYGPSEFTVDALVAEITGDTPVVGVPSKHCYVRILDDQGLQVEPGEIGEICLGGAQVAWGYINSTRLTAERFVPDAYADAEGARLYRSGDFGRMTAAGVEYLGRRDGQIKLNGLRVELGEIETALSRVTGVSRAVALPVPLDGDVVRLAAFVTVTSPVEIDRLREQASSDLPRHMVPSSFTAVTSIPVRSSGKIDQHALLNLESLPRISDERDDENDLANAQTLAARDIMSEVLRITNVSLDDDFFQLGGHSLTAIQAMTRLNARFETDLSLSSIFDASTPRALGELLTGDGRRLEPAAPERPAEPDERFVPLSSAQQRLWLLQSEIPGDVAYNMTEAFALQGSIDTDRLIAAVERALSGHAELLGRIDDNGPAPVQVISTRRRSRVQYHDWNGAAPADVDDRLQALLREVSSTPYDLSRGDLYRAHVAGASHGNAYLVLGFHHVVADGWSVSVLLEEVSKLYEGDGTPRPSLAEPVVVPDRDDPDMPESMRYWLGELAGASQNIRLGAEQDRERASSAGDRITIDLEDELVLAIDALAARTRTTTYIATLTVFHIAVARWSGEDTVLVGMPVAGRTASHEDSGIGFYVNTLAIRHEQDERDTYLDALARTRRRVVQGLTHQRVPFDSLVREIAPERRLSTNPLVQVTYQLFEQDIDGALSLAGVAVRPLNVFNNTARFDLSLDLFRRGTGLSGWLYFATDVYDEEIARRFSESFLHLIRQVVADESAPLALLSLVEPRSRTAANNSIGAAEHSPPLVMERWARTVASSSRDTAVVDDHGTVDFTTMDELVSTFASTLVESGFQPGDIVALGLPRDRSGLALLLASWREGLVAVPLDLSVPEERTSLAVGASQAVAVVTAHHSPSDGWSRLFVRHLPPGEPGGATPDAAYIILTSGSTGVPKPVIVSHASLANLAAAHEAGIMRAHPTAIRVLHSASFGFDVAMDHLLWLIAGRQLYIASEDIRRDMDALAAYITTHRMHVVNVTPSVAAHLVPPRALEGPDMQVVIVGGEDVNEFLWSYLSGLSAAAYNFYGPTEATVDTTTHRMRRNSRRQLGSALTGSSVRLLDSIGRLVPVGVAGEICIGGPGLAWGYWGDAAATAERFVPDAWSTVPGARLYRSGDMAYRRSSGELSYLGRSDRQVKLRGHRIELGEVETALAAAGLAGASVSLASIGTRPVLVAHAPLRGNETASQTALENWRDVFLETHDQATHAERGAEHGWVDSATGSAIGQADMEEWASSTAARIVALAPRHVFELGAGTGLIMDRLLGSGTITSYTGSDLSSAALPFLEQIARRHNDVAYRLFESEAIKATEAITPDVDTVVINSVSQYLPSLAHLEKLVGQAVDHLSDGATLFIGDIRNPHVERFGRSITGAVDQDSGSDPELSIDTRFWEYLLAVVPRISGIEIAPRLGAALNEMTRYRYDVIIHVAQHHATPAIEWNDGSPVDHASVEQALGSRRNPFGWRAVENARTGPGPGPRPGAWNPHDLFLIARRQGWSAQVSWSRHDVSGRFDVIFLPPGHPATRDHGVMAPVVTTARVGADEIEFVLPPRTDRSLTRAVLDRMRVTVPDVLVPASLTLLLQLPLTANGKIDSAALSRVREPAPTVAPRSPANEVGGVAQRVAAVFSGVTSHAPIALDDDFFDVGGDSLSAATAARDLRRLGLDVSIRMILAGRTPQTIARLLEEAHETGG